LKAEIWNHNDWIADTNPKTLKVRYERLLIESGFGILNFIEHNFEPQGWTGLWLLTESHFAIHTFPEEQRTYIELSSCNKGYYDWFINA
jgi:S-adenosylmethionine decarboxylase